MAKELKRNSSKGFKGKTKDSPKRKSSGKQDQKSSFDRYRDDSRPSDFGSPKKRGTSTYNGRSNRSDEKPSDKKREDNGDNESSKIDEKPSFRNKKSSFSNKPAFKKSFSKFSEKKSFAENKKEKSFRSKPFSDKLNSRSSANPYDLDESDLEYGKEKPNFNSERGRGFKKKPYAKKTYSGKKNIDSKPQRTVDDGMIRLNKYIANAGICSRREADDLITSGVVQVNGKTITEMGFRIKATDIIKYGGQTLKKEKLVYLILNKPKDYITTVDDPQKRKTVLELVQGACRERIYPVGRLDRATTGLLMFTNDGELTKKLTHPRYGVRKIYHVSLDKPLKHTDMDKIKDGLELEDGSIKVDEVTYVGDGADKHEVGVEIHSGKNRIVRRIFESLGYNVRKLDRVVFGPLTKKDMARGRWRILTDAEVGMLKMIGGE